MTKRLPALIALAAAAAVPALAHAQAGTDCDPAYGGCDVNAPKVTISLTGAKLRTLARSGRLDLKVKVDEASRVKLGATGRAGSAKLSFTSDSLRFKGATRKSATLELTSSSRAALRRYVSAGGSKARVTIKATARDASDNTRRLNVTKTIS